MPTRLDTLPRPIRPKGISKHADLYTTVMDGQPWFIAASEFGRSTRQSFRVQLHKVAAARGLTIKTRQAGEGLCVQTARMR